MSCSTQNIKAKLDQEISTVNINKTAVLFFTKQEVEDFESVLRNINYVSTTNQKSKNLFDVKVRGLKISTIKSFKGLEIDNVILVLNEQRRGTRLPENIKEEIYVGLTRATKCLIIIDQLNNDCVRDIYENFNNGF